MSQEFEGECDACRSGRLSLADVQLVEVDCGPRRGERLWVCDYCRQSVAGTRLMRGQPVDEASRAILNAANTMERRILTALLGTKEQS